MAGSRHAFRFALSGCALAGIRLSALRTRILEALAESVVPVVVELFVREQAVRLGTHPVTVYRFLGELQEAAVLLQVTVIGRRAVLMSCQSANWLVCRGCGTMHAVSEPEVLSRWKSELSRRTGFRIDHHWCEANGFCPTCEPTT